MKRASLPLQRREFITLLGAAAVVSWPRAVVAQQADRIRRVGMLIGYAENDAETQARLLAFRAGLDRLGWRVGNSILCTCEPRSGPAVRERAGRLATRCPRWQFDACYRRTPA
jgi:hypothetical protein